MKIHILGICGKFMSGIALIAKQKGFQVSGSDQNLLEPTSSMLASLGIELIEGYEAHHLPQDIDYVIVGNALSRGKGVLEFILNQNIPYYSGPEWLLRNVLQGCWVIAVAGTHGKTTTTSMVAWILERAGFSPGFLIGGNPLNFEFSARYTGSTFFVIEADEYDTAFFDKRSKFLHYKPNTLIINNLEFDHADIFQNLEDIKRQFVHLLRLVPGNGLIVAPSQDEHIGALLRTQCYTSVETFGRQEALWTARKLKEEGSAFEVYYDQKRMGLVEWGLVGDHNVQNAIAALAAARHVGVLPHIALDSLCHFKGVKRRLELKGKVRGISVYDDFAHHPTAIATTLHALRCLVKQERIFAVVEFGSHTMRAGHHEQLIVSAFLNADYVILLRPHSDWRIERLLSEFNRPVKLFNTVPEIIRFLVGECQEGDHILCMSNLQFDNIQHKLLQQLPLS
jgi:UDP-N-acetylmuramate: L-alanyl-gamma-D-glutamyl-meso-diaminopimelate ligase